MFIKGLGSLGKTLAAVGGPTGGLFAQAVQGVGKVLLKVRDFAVGAKAGFSSLTNGIKEFGKTALNKIGFNIEGAATNFFGEGETAFSRTMDGFSDAGKIIRGVRDKSFTVSAEDGFNIDDFSDQIGISKDDLFKLNPGLEGKLINGVTIPKTTYVNLDLAQGSLLGFDPEKISQINQKAVADAFIGPPAPEGSAFVNPRLEAAQVTDPTIPGYVEEAFQSETRQFPTTVDATTGLPIDATKQEMTKPFQAEDAMKTKTRTNVEIPPEGGSAIVRP